jgi:hypothetical protein
MPNGTPKINRARTVSAMRPGMFPLRAGSEEVLPWPIQVMARI